MNPFDGALELHPRPSGRLSAFVLIVHAAAFAALAVAALRQPWLWAVAPAMAVSLVWSWRRARLAFPGAIVRLLWRPDGDWRWEFADGGIYAGRLLPSSICLPSLVLLHLRPAGQKRVVAVPLAPDSVGDPDLFRRLRARLKVSGAG